MLRTRFPQQKELLEIMEMERRRRMTPEYKTLSEKSSVSLHHKRRQLEAEGWTPAGEVVETPRQMIYDIENHTETIQYRYTLVMSRNDHKYRNDQIKFARSQTQLISQINAVFTTHAKEDFGHDFSKGSFLHSLRQTSSSNTGDAKDLRELVSIDL